jgi:hypothetical protein
MPRRSTPLTPPFRRSTRRALEEFLSALDLVKEHKQSASVEAHYEGDGQLSEWLAAAANAAIAALAAAKAARQER